MTIKYANIEICMAPVERCACSKCMASLAESRRNRMVEVKAECGSCEGTGIYCGFAEPEGTGVVCLTCDGTGCRTIKYKPFQQRKRKTGVKQVYRSRGTFIGMGVGPMDQNGVTYQEFLDGKLP